MILPRCTRRLRPREDIARVLLQAGANARATDDDGQTPLHVLAGRDAPSPPRGRYASKLHKAVAASSSCFKTGVDFFVEEAGIAVDFRDSGGRTALHLACSRGNREAITALVSHGAAINMRGQSPLHYAAEAGSAETVSLLLGLGADANCVGGRSITPLHLACSSSHRGVCVALLSHRTTNVDAQDSEGRTALHLAVASQGGSSRDPGDEAVTIVDLLLRAGADETIANNEGDIPLVAIVKRTRSIRSLYLPASLLLKRSPADRTWRRRCLLLLCCAFPEKARLEPIEPSAKFARSAEGGGAVAALTPASGAGRMRKKIPTPGVTSGLC